MKKIALVLSMGLVLTGAGCSSNDVEDYPVTDDRFIVDVAGEMEEEVEVFQGGNRLAPEYIESEYFGEMKFVGDSTFGYIPVPFDWVRFIDATGIEGLLQYTDFGVNIVTANLFQPTSLTLQEFAEGFHDALLQTADEVSSLEETRVGDYEAFGFKIHYEWSDTYMGVLVFQRNNGMLQTITVEGEAETIARLITLIEDNFAS